MADLKREFCDDGFCFAKQCFTASELAEFGRLFDHVVQQRGLLGQERFAIGDFVAHDPFCWPLALNDRLAGLARAVLHDRVAWVQQADIHLNVGTTLHRDCVDRFAYGAGADWTDTTPPYAIVRLAIYLDGSAQSGSQLLLSPKSHRSPTTALSEFAVAPGDCLLFDPRLLHGSTTPTGRKRAMYFCYGAPNKHTHRLEDWFVRERKDLGYKPLSPELDDLLARHGLSLRR